MRLIPIILTICLSLLLCQPVLRAQAAFHQRPYKGARLSLTDVVAKKKGNQVSFEFTAINTGRKNLVLRKGKPAEEELVIDFDNSLEVTGSARLQSTIASAILAGEWSIELSAGATQKGQSIKVSLDKYPAFDVQPAKNPGPAVASRQENAPAQTVSKTPEPLPSSSTAPVRPDNSIPPAGASGSNTPGVKNNAGTTAATVSKTQTEDNSTTKDNGSGKVTDVRFADGCADLMVEQIILNKRTKKAVEVTLVLLNKGNKKALIYAKDKKSTQRLAIRAQLNATDQLTRGAIVLGGAFIEDGLEKSNGYLLPGHTLEIPLKFSTTNATRFTPFLILSLDVYQLVDECDESNNNQGIKIEK